MKKTLAIINAAVAVMILGLMARTFLPAARFHEGTAILGGKEGPTEFWLTTDSMDKMACIISAFFCTLFLANTWVLFKSGGKS